jgi:1-acyl-sn-glycerol-3-phosphate acyltransferase
MAGRRALVSAVRLLTRVFFRRIEVTGIENVPASGGGIVIAWHPNGMVDPALILASFPRPLVFGARHGLFKWPLLGTVLRALGTVPIYRASDAARLDPEARRAANRASLDALAAEVARGSFCSLFPEGVSHDAPHPVELKTGIARLFDAARLKAGPDAPSPLILPVGLHYDEKRAFRSSALVAFHPPVELPAELAAAPPDDEPLERAAERWRALVELLERVLRDVVHATDDWETHYLMHRARKLVRAERAHRAGADPGPVGIAERTLGFQRVWQGYYERMETHPGEVAALRARVEQYDADLRALRLEDHQLDRDPRFASPLLGVLLALQAVAVYLLLPPFLVVGYLVNGLPALAVLGLARVLSKERKDFATAQILIGLVFFPIVWGAVGVAGAQAHVAVHETFPAVPDTPALVGLLLVLLSILGGATAVRYLRLARETARGLRVRLTRRIRRRQIARLRAERAELCAAIESIAAGLALPGAVQSDGRVVI